MLLAWCVESYPQESCLRCSFAIDILSGKLLLKVLAWGYQHVEAITKCSNGTIVPQLAPVCYVKWLPDDIIPCDPNPVSHSAAISFHITLPPVSTHVHIHTQLHAHICIQIPHPSTSLFPRDPVAQYLPSS